MTIVLAVPVMVMAEESPAHIVELPLMEILAVGKGLTTTLADTGVAPHSFLTVSYIV